VYRAKIAEQAERYDDMMEYMKEVVKCGCELSVEERNLLSVAYKNAIGSRRASWRIVKSVEQKENSKGDGANSQTFDTLKDYRESVEKELNNICEDVLSLLTDHLVCKSSGESLVFYLKMKGDYHRYRAEFFSAGEKDKAADDARLAYEAAWEVADKELCLTHPIRLGLALNFSVFYYEVLLDSQKACNMAKDAFTNAIKELDTVHEESYKDSTLIMQLLRDNLTLWTSDDQEADAREG